MLTHKFPSWWVQAAEYKLNRAAFDMKAKQMTEKHAVEAKESAAAESSDECGKDSGEASPSAAAAPAEPAAETRHPDCQVKAK